MFLIVENTLFEDGNGINTFRTLTQFKPKRFIQWLLLTAFGLTHKSCFNLKQSIEDCVEKLKFDLFLTTFFRVNSEFDNEV